MAAASSMEVGNTLRNYIRAYSATVYFVYVFVAIHK